MGENGYLNNFLCKFQNLIKNSSGMEFIEIVKEKIYTMKGEYERELVYE